MPWLRPQIPGDTLLCVENHWYQDVALPEEQLALSDTERIAACLDTGHGLLAGVRPERFVARLGQRLGHVHLKDAAAPPLPLRLLGRRVRRRLFARPEPVFPGRGALDVARTREALADAGYAGAVSLEYEGPDASAGMAALLELWERAG